jgi:hypothetical protein
VAFDCLLVEPGMNTLPSQRLPRQWPLFLAGLLLFAAGPVAYIVQVQLEYLIMPWYVPILASVGVLLMALSVWQRGGLWRNVGTVFFLLLCAGEWFMLLATTAPQYTGPAQTGRKVPAFATTLADGSSFTDRDLQNGTPALLLFFRGRW